MPTHLRQLAGVEALVRQEAARLQRLCRGILAGRATAQLLRVLLHLQDVALHAREGSLLHERQGRKAQKCLSSGGGGQRSRRVGPGAIGGLQRRASATIGAVWVF